MRPETIAILRSAVCDAVQGGNNESAMELLTLLVDGGASARPQHALPGLTVTEGPARDFYFWAELIREQFVPFLVQNGRHQFTTHELLRWLERCGGLQFTTGDLEPLGDGTTLTWKSRTSNALRHLKQQGILRASPSGRLYTAVTAARSLPASTPSGDPMEQLDVLLETIRSEPAA